jgi:hypothetical protein
MDLLGTGRGCLGKRGAHFGNHLSDVSINAVIWGWAVEQVSFTNEMGMSYFYSSLVTPVTEDREKDSSRNVGFLSFTNICDRLDQRIQRSEKRHVS